MSLADREILELHALCDALVDGVLTEAQRARLEQWLATSEEARRGYVRVLALSASLMDYAGEMQAEAPDAPPPERTRVVRPAAWVWAIGSLAAAAVVVLAFLLGAARPRSVTGEIASAPHDSDDAVARISGAKDSRWTGRALPAGEELHREQRLELASGLVEITFDSGAQITLEGPASLELNSAWDAVLHRGTLKASVPPEAIGFRVSNPSVAVVDLGTEFSMVADETGATEVFVLQGAVEAAGRDAAGNEAPPMVLREKQARRFARAGASEVRDHDTKLARFMRKVVFDRLTRQVTYAHWSFDGAGADFTAADGGKASHFRSLTGSDLLQARTVGYWNDGLRLDGKLAAKVPFPGIRQRTARTVAFWVNLPADAPLTDAGAMVSWPLGGAGRCVTVGWNRHPGQGPFGALRTDTGRGDYVGGTPLRDGRWHHVAVVFSPKTKGGKGEGGMQLRQYVDGRLEAASARHFGKRGKDPEALAAPIEDALWIGRAMDRAGREQFRGTFDELFVADAALTPREILHLLRENQSAPPEMLAAQ